MTCWPDTDIPKSHHNAFDWRSTYALQQTGMSVPWEKYRDKHEDKAKLERRVHAMPKSSIALQKSNPSRIPDIPKSLRGA